MQIDNYTGSKGGAGVYQKIINHIPWFTDSYEVFAGSAIISRKMSELDRWHKYYMIEKNEAVRDQLKNICTRNLMLMDFLDGMEFLQKVAEKPEWYRKCFLYLDPPYMKSTRRIDRNIYKYEWNSDDHVEFLDLVTSIPTEIKIMISHYDCSFYRKTLEGWHTKEFNARTRGKTAVEKIWMNYDIQEHDLAVTDFVGENFSERQRIKRKKESYLEKFKTMHRHERQAVLEHIKKQL